MFWFIFCKQDCFNTNGLDAMSSLMSTYVPFRAFKIQNSDFLFYFEIFNFV